MTNKLSILLFIPILIATFFHSFTTIDHPLVAASNMEERFASYHNERLLTLRQIYVDVGNVERFVKERKAEQLRLEQERLEQERIEKEKKLEQERLEEERLEKERLEEAKRIEEEKRLEEEKRKQQQQQKEEKKEEKTQTTKEEQATTAYKGISSFERDVVKYTNQARVNNGLPELSIDNRLSEVAWNKSNDMQVNNYFAHTSPTYGSPFDMMQYYGISYTAAGENIAMGYSSPKSLVDGWMNSEGHRKNILNENYTHIGVGFVENGYYSTQLFIRK